GVSVEVVPAESLLKPAEPPKPRSTGWAPGARPAWIEGSALADAGQAAPPAPVQDAGALPKGGVGAALATFRVAAAMGYTGAPMVAGGAPPGEEPMGPGGGEAGPRDAAASTVT